jgi:molybdopterin-guanine dinucleotide biosynthesis protein A
VERGRSAGGIATCLTRTQSALLLVLAIASNSARILKKLLARSDADCGVVPIHHRRFEPLIALYPRAALKVAIDQLREQDYVLQHFIDKLFENHLMIGYEIELGEQNQMENWNTPGDLSPL